MRYYDENGDPVDPGYDNYVGDLYDRSGNVVGYTDGVSIQDSQTIQMSPATDGAEDDKTGLAGFLQDSADFMLGTGWKILLALVILWIIWTAIEIVSQKTAIVIERLGKFHDVKHAGLRFRIPLIDQVVQTMTLQIEQLKENVKVKTSDNVFVTLPVSVFVQVREDLVKDAYYELDEPYEAIIALVLNEIKSAAAGMTLEEVFASRDHLATSVQQTLEVKFTEYGFAIINVVVDNPLLSEQLEASFDSVMAAEREKDAATAKAEALKIREVGIATANAAGLEISAHAQVTYRNTIAEGHADAIKKMTADTGLDDHEALRFLTVTDGNDAIRDAARNGATVVVASPTHTDGLYANLPSLANGHTARQN